MKALIATLSLLSINVHAIFNSNDLIHLSDDTFDKKVLNSGKPWIVTFYADWCPWSAKFSPIYERIATELKGGRLQVAAIDASINQKTKYEYKIWGYPQIKFFAPHTTQVTAEFWTDREYDKLMAFIDKQLAAVDGRSVRVSRELDNNNGLRHFTMDYEGEL